MYNSSNTGFLLDDNVYFLNSDFEFSFKLIFDSSSLIKEEDEEEANNNSLDSRYFNLNKGNNFVPKNDDNDKEIKSGINQTLKSKNLLIILVTKKNILVLVLMKRKKANLLQYLCLQIKVKI